MGGICGVWNLDGRPTDARVMSDMSRTLQHRGLDGERSRIEGGVGFSCQHMWVAAEDHAAYQPIVGESGAMLVMDGRLDNRENLVRALALDRRVSDARCVMSAYERWPGSFVERLAGDFAVAVFDPSAQRLVLARDAMGVRPLYYFHGARLFAFASEIKALLAHPDITPKPDDEGVADCLLIGSRPIDQRHSTCFQGVSAVVPAHIVTVTASELTRTRYWDFDTERELRFRSFEEYVEAFGSHFKEAVKRRIRSQYPVAVSVSGGLDSASIFCQAETLRREGVVPTPAIAGVSYISGRDGTDEQAYLRDIEATYGVDVDRFPIEPLIGVVDGMRQQVAAAEAPFVDYLWGVTRELHTRATATGARSLLSGHLGDQLLFSPAYLVDLVRRNAWPTIWRHTREYGRYFGDPYTARRRRSLVVDTIRHHAPRALAPSLKWLRQRVLERQRPKGWFSPPFISTALRDRYQLAAFDRRFHSAHARGVYTEARSRYHGHSIEWNMKVAAHHGLDAAFPFFDRDLIAFLMAIPGEIHARNGVPRILLRQALRGILPDSIRTRTWKSDFSSVVNQGVGRDAAEIMNTMTSDCQGVRFGYLDADRLASALARFPETLDAADCRASWDLADTYGLEMWLRVFWGGQGSGVDTVLPPSEESS
jgi:asparagine synthase (glutamine-hydrolysing)